MTLSLSEDETRKQKIDILLKQSGWDVLDSTKVITEVDTKQSDFDKRKYKFVKDTFHDSSIDEKFYADYILLDSSGAPLAVIEAKRENKSPILGQRQAEDYAKDIKNQTKKDVFIFLTNGYEIWFWNWPFDGPRLVSGFHNRDALERIRYQNYFKKDFADVPIRKDIIDRPYQVEAVKRVLEGIEKGKRKFLIVQATGTGKTRVAMAIIDVLLRSNHAQKILFLADRTALRDQAFSDGFKVFFPNELQTKVFSGKLDKSNRLYASTIQTFMECYQEFSPGDFDVIISDECHRSIYNKWKEVFTYFDAIEIGLTATPADSIEKDTFRFFDCDEGIPTALYTYDQALKDKWLVPFDLYKMQTQFQLKGVKSKDIPNGIKNELIKKGIDAENIDFEGSQIEKAVVVIGTNEAIVKEFMENCIMDSTGTLPAKSIIFAITKEHAKRIWEAFEKLYPEYKGKLARIIVSEDSRAQETLKAFKTEEWPRVAISVDMLDTGIDVPEVCNLVFAKMVFSKIKFWQMIGRGTRNDQACKHKDWLENGEKSRFLIFDCWNVFDWFNIHQEGKEVQPSEVAPAKIFLLQLQQFGYFQTKNDEVNASKVKEKLLNNINKLPLRSVTIKEHARDIELALSPKLWERKGLDPIAFLKKQITPLMRYQQDVNPQQAAFIQKCEQLSLAILQNDSSEISRLADSVAEDLECLPITIEAVKIKEKLLDRALNKSFWISVSYDDVQLLLSEFAPLMKYKRSEPRPKITLDIDDIVKQRTLIEFGPVDAPKQEYIEKYKEKVEKHVMELAEMHPTIMKIKHDEVLTESDLISLENTLNSPELFITEQNLEKIYQQSNGTLVEFIKKILGLYEFQAPEKEIEDAFKAFVIEHNYLNPDQVLFLRTMQTVFIKEHKIEFADLYEAPFTNFGSNAPIPLFNKEELTEAIQMCRTLKKNLHY